MKNYKQNDNNQIGEVTGPIPERIRQGHRLNSLISKWDNIMIEYFENVEKAIMNKTEMPDTEKMLLERRRLEDLILSLSN